MAVLSTELAQLVSDAQAWNRWASRINAKALAAGLVTAETLEANRQASRGASARLIEKIASSGGIL